MKRLDLWCKLEIKPLLCLESTMQLVLSVDLALKQSAYVLQQDAIILQGDSWGFGLKTQDQFVLELAQVAREYRPDVVMIEDLPVRVSFMGTTKGVCRLQGRIEDRFYQYGIRELLLWVQPVTWKAWWKLNGKDSAKLIEPKALEVYGYKPPLDFTQYHGKERQSVKKTASDYAAAFMIGKWAQETYIKNNEYIGNVHRSHGD